MITPAGSTAGTYTVTYTVAAANGCALFSTTASVTITAAFSGTIAYSGTPFCTSSPVVNVTSTAPAGGTYSYTGAGTLSLNTATGDITPSTSTNGTYTVTYKLTGTGGCANYSTSTSVQIVAAPTAVAGPDMSTCSNTGADQHYYRLVSNQPEWCCMDLQRYGNLCECQLAHYCYIYT